MGKERRKKKKKASILRQGSAPAAETNATPNFFSAGRSSPKKFGGELSDIGVTFGRSTTRQSPAENASDSYERTQYLGPLADVHAIVSTLDLFAAFHFSPRPQCVAGELVRSQTSSLLRLSFAAPMQPVPTTNSPAGTIILAQ